MNGKAALTVVLVAVVSMSFVVPVSHASNIRVYLDPNSNQATVDAYINSSLSISASNSSNIGQILLHDILSGSSGHNVSIAPTQLNESSLAYSVINASIAKKDPEATLKSLSLGFSRNVENSTGNGLVTVYANSSLKINMLITGIFSNNTVNMIWRSFSTNQGIEMNGTQVNNANFGNLSLGSSSSVNTLNMSAFSTSLINWNRSYDQATNVTTFTINAGNTVSLHYNSTISGNSFSLNFNIDPSYSISTPGYATAGTDSIQISSPPGQNPAIFYAIGVVMVGGALLLMYASRRRNRN